MNVSDIKQLVQYTEWHHVANHATMHRGQVVGMIRQLGIDPAATDLLFYLRRNISPK